MKHFVILFLGVLYCQGAMGQIVINRPIRSEDLLSRKLYSSINFENQKISGATKMNSLSIEGLTKVIREQNTELTVISPLLLSKQLGLNNFVSNSSFGSQYGYNCYGYIQEKYPVVGLVSPSEMLRNKLIRMRFLKKLNFERDRINDYFNPTNPISEGERVLLILSSLENVINQVLENETY